MAGMQMAMIAGGSEPVVFVADANPSQVASSPTSATAEFVLLNNRTTQSTGEGPANWLSANGAVADYDVRATLVSGSITGTMATWLNLATTRLWSVTKNGAGAGVVTAQMTIEIRHAVTLVVLDTATVIFYAEVF